MKKLFFSTKILLSTFLAIALISCSAEDGTDGATGPQGPAGQNGIDGIDGEDGNANVIYSGWQSFQQAQRDTVIDGTNLKVNHLNAPELTSEIRENGAILVYMRFLTTIMPLPYTSDAGAGDRPSTVSFVPSPNRLYITRYTHDDSGSIGFGAVQFRYILIPGSTNGVSGKNNGVPKNFNVKYTFEELKQMSYEEVIDHFGLEY